MTVRRIMLAIAAFCLLSGAVQLAPAQEKIVVPQFLANMEGGGRATGTGGPGRVQYLFLASDFTGLSESQRLITNWNFRSDISQSEPVTWTFDEFMIWMSTTDKNTLTRTFDNNHGPDKTLVHNGSYSRTFLTSGPDEGPRDFGVSTRFLTPFNYDPFQGNLLVEVIAQTNSVPFPGPNLDGQDTDLEDIRVLGGSPNSMTGSPLNATAIAQFSFVPEPSSLGFVLVSCLCIGVIARGTAVRRFRGLN